ncbi:MAG: hypothetical protein IH599_04695, partial [Bacteroidales bacterium]|nr:hypothetical protein [Bacteroidales bacterium]
MKHSYGHQLRVVIASGEGEPWLRPASATGPEWISGALVVRPGNTIRQLIMGDLR